MDRDLPVGTGLDRQLGCDRLTGAEVQDSGTRCGRAAGPHRVREPLVLEEPATTVSTAVLTPVAGIPPCPATESWIVAFAATGVDPVSRMRCGEAIGW